MTYAAGRVVLRSQDESRNRHQSVTLLDAIAELTEYRFRKVDGVLRDEVDTNSFRANQADDFFNLLKQCFRSIVK